MTIRERLLGISELNIEQKLMHMRGGQLDEYVQTLNMFVDSYPTLEEELKEALEEKDYFSFSGCLSDIRDMLVNIRADELAEECLKLINGLASIKHEKIEARTTFLLSVLTMLSIDVQMAVHKPDEDEQLVEYDMPYIPETGKKSILAVDDNAFFLDTLKSALHDTEYKLICVNSGISAMRFLQNHSPDLFILDIEMPEMDGYELAQKIRGYGKKAPIIFLTGNSTKECVMKALTMGAADFIVKPITKNQVLERIRRHLYPPRERKSDDQLSAVAL